MRSWKSKLGRWGVLSAFSLALLTSPAFAQKKKGDDEERLPPYDVAGLNHSKQIVPWVAAFLFACAVLAIAFKNPHRTHLD